jgi:hypothetical protein
VQVYTIWQALELFSAVSPCLFYSFPKDLELLVYNGQYLIRHYPFEKFVWLPGGGVTLCRVMNYFRVSLNVHISPRLKMEILNENCNLYASK